MNVVFDQVARAFSARKSAAAAADGPEVRLAVMVGDKTPPDLAAAVREALVPQTANARLYIAGFGDAQALPSVNGLSDAAVVTAGPHAALAGELYRSYRAAGVPCCVVLSNREGAAACARCGVEAADVLACGPADVESLLGSWLVSALPDLSAALGACFPCCRRAQARTVVLEATRNNALVGALAFLKEADMPVMMATEIAMVYKMAQTYDLPLDAGRFKEIAAVVASSFGLRGVARLAVKVFPLPSFLVKSVVAGAGTFAVGKALMAYYDSLSALPSPVAVQTQPQGEPQADPVQAV